MTNSFDSSPSKALLLEIGVLFYWAWQPASYQERAITLDKAMAQGWCALSLCSPIWNHMLFSRTFICTGCTETSESSTVHERCTQAEEVTFSPSSSHNHRGSNITSVTPSKKWTTFFQGVKGGSQLQRSSSSIANLEDWNTPPPKKKIKTPYLTTVPCTSLIYTFTCPLSLYSDCTV